MRSGRQREVDSRQSCKNRRSQVNAQVWFGVRDGSGHKLRVDGVTGKATPTTDLIARPSYLAPISARPLCIKYSWYILRRRDDGAVTHNRKRIKVAEIEEINQSQNCGS